MDMVNLNPEAVANRLKAWGYLDAAVDTVGIPFENADLIAAVQRYQSAYHLLLDVYTHRHHARESIADGDVGPASVDLFMTPRCDVRDLQAHEVAQESNWPTACRTKISYAYRLDELNIDAATIKARVIAGLGSWSQRLNLNFDLQDNLSTAMIWATAGSLSGSTLAWSYLAQNTCNTRLEQRYNTRINWDGQYFQAVVAHEVGHALGLEHINDPAALMYPYARKSIYEPQALDVAAMVRNGYTKRTEPTPPQPPLPPGDPVDYSVTGPIIVRIGTRKHVFNLVEETSDTYVGGKWGW